MIDEFQDSSEIQFKLGLLLASTENICVVGDWKQSIYSFQYADVENILDFEDRLSQFAADLNRDASRVPYDTSAVETIELEQNYRSTQELLDFSEQSLTTPATSSESLDVNAIRDRIVSLDATTEHDHARIEASQHEDEHEAIVAAITDIVGNSAYQVRDEDDELRDPELRDITVLTRTRDFGRELQSVADEHGLPMAYEGGIELFRTDQAKLLLAWLRILDSDADRGWAPVLERAGYTIDEVEHILDTGEYPEPMLTFREELASRESLGGVMRQVFDRYGFDGSRADVLLHTVESIRETTTLTVGDLIRFISRGIERGSTHEVNTSAAENSVTVQTIHATKGLEHPIVILANMNSRRFPPSGGGSPTITYDDAAGLRHRKTFAEAHGHPYVYDNWKTDVITRCLDRDYDEERRLLYVAITRAENHVRFTAGEDPNTFLEALPVEIEPGHTTIGDIDVTDADRSTLTISIPGETGPTQYSPHSLMDTSVYEDVEQGRGTEFGTRVHDYAEALVLGADVAPQNADEEHVARFIDSLDGDLRPEEQVYLPLETSEGRVTLSGVVDLLHITPDTVDIIDYKTDRGRHAESEYRKQLSVYYHVLTAVYPERTISASIFYTETGQQVAIDPLSKSALKRLVEETATLSRT